MNELLNKVKTYYKEHPLFQLIVMFVSIFFVIFMGYQLSMNSADIYKGLTEVDYKMTSSSTAQSSSSSKQKETQVTRIDAPPRQAPIDANNNPEEAQKQSVENQKRLEENRRKKFDSDVEKNFQFEDKF